MRFCECMYVYVCIQESFKSIGKVLQRAGKGGRAFPEQHCWQETGEPFQTHGSAQLNMR